MERTCLACHKPLVGRQRKWCSNACTQRAAFNKKTGRPIDARTWITSAVCSWCQADISDRGPQSRYCSTQCRIDANHRAQLMRRHQDRQKSGLPIPGDLVPCGNPQCFNAAIYSNRRAYCSSKCQQYVQANKHWLGDGPSTRIYFYPCPDCQTLLLSRVRNGSHKVCQPCRVMRNKAINARKNHARRAAGLSVMSVGDIAKRDGCRCHICHRKIDLNLPGTAKWGPTIEHITPVSLGGTNEPSNLALAHRHCNTARGNRGGSQLLLVA